MSFPSECVLQRRVRSRGDADLAATNLPLFILECKDRMADGYEEDELEFYNQKLEDMVIGVRLAAAPPAVSYLAILGARLGSRLSAEIVAVNKNVIVIRLDIWRDEGVSYLIYDAVALSLRLIPEPDANFSRLYPLSHHSVSFTRPCRGPDYALAHTGREDSSGNGDFLVLWRPSSWSPPWSEYKKAILPDNIPCTVNKIDTEFTFNGYAYWVDLLCGVSYCSCDALFDDSRYVVKFREYLRLPVPSVSHDLRVAEPAAYRTMGVVCDSFIRFVSIDGFQDYVQLKDRTVTVWRLLGNNRRWEEEHKLSLEALWGFEGFGDLPKDLTPMYPLLSTDDTDVIYLVLGEYVENEFDVERGLEFYPSNPRYLLAVDMRNKIVRTFEPQPREEQWFDSLISCRFNRCLREALVGPCHDDGTPMKKKPRRKKCRCCEGNVPETTTPLKKPRLEKKRRRRDGENVAEAPIPMKRKKHRRCRCLRSRCIAKLANIIKRLTE